MLAIQAAGVAFGLLMLSATYLYFRRRYLTAVESGAWVILWVGFLVVAVRPKIVGGLVQSVGIVRPLDLFMIVGLAVALSLSFRVHLRLKKIERKIEDMVRADALGSAHDQGVAAEPGPH